MASLECSAESVFCEALEQETPPDRAAYLDRACANDVTLRQRVDRLLLAHEQQGGFLDKPLIRLESDEFLLENTPSDQVGRDTNADRAPATQVDESQFGFLSPTNDPRYLGKLGPYEVMELAGRGGMGIVFRAFDAGLDREVAIEVLAPELAANATARERFSREARTVAAVRHENIIAIHLVDEINALPHFVMEFVRGQSLGQRLVQSGGLELAEIVRIGRQTARALAAAHDHGLIHRDIKPANILLEDETDRVVITDFGLARAMDDASITRTGMIAGTPQYMSPEQAQGRSIDHRSDLFSLGGVLHATCTGKPPFQGETTLSLIKSVCEDPPSSIKEIRADIPDWLMLLIERLLEKSPQRRIQSSAEVADILDQAAGPAQHNLDEALKQRIGIPVGDARWRSRSTVIGATAVGLMAITAAAYWGPGNDASSNDKTDPKKHRSSRDVPSDAPKRKTPADSVVDAPVEEPSLLIKTLRAHDELFSLAVSPDGSFIYAGGINGVIYVWEFDTGRLIHRIQKHTSAVTDLTVSRDGSRLASTGLDRNMFIWDTATAEWIGGSGMIVPMAFIEFAPDGKTVVGSPNPAQRAGGRRPPSPRGDPRRRLWVFDATTGQTQQPLWSKPPQKISSLAWSHDGKRIAVTTLEKSVVWFDPQTGLPTGQWHEDQKIRALCFSPDDRRLYYCYDSLEIRARDFATNQIVFQRRFQDGVGVFAISSDSHWMAIAGASALRLVNMQSPADPLITIDGPDAHTAPIQSVLFLPQGDKPGSDRIVTCSRDHTVRVWKLPSKPSE